MDTTETGGPAVNYGGTVGDAAGRAAGRDAGSTTKNGPAKDGPATADEQLDRILPSGNVPGLPPGGG